MIETTRRRIPALDGVRALAVLAVLAFHAGHLRGGYAGVDLFFVLSGFLITSLLVRELEDTRTIRFRAFYIRRVLRLAPAVLVLLAAMWVGVLATQGRTGTDPALMASTTLWILSEMGNWAIAFGRRWPVPLLHVWTLSVEEQFYLVWPPVLWLLLRSGVPLRRIALWLLVAAVAVALWRANVWERTHDILRVYMATDTRADGLMFGVVVALLGAAGVNTPRWLTMSLGWIGAIVLTWVMSHRGMEDSIMFRGGYSVTAVSAAIVIRSVVDGPHPLITRVLSLGWLRWIGRISYGLYLWNQPMVWAVERFHLPQTRAALVGIALTFTAACASYYAVEQPALRLKRRLAPRAHRVGATVS